MAESKRASVRVLCFASFAELMGTDQLDLPITPGQTLGDLLDSIRQSTDRDLPPSMLTAVNLRHVPLDTVLQPGDEVALLPPLAGG